MSVDTAAPPAVQPDRDNKAAGGRSGSGMVGSSDNGHWWL
jgi:hypothetical protein